MTMPISPSSPSFYVHQDMDTEKAPANEQMESEEKTAEPSLNAPNISEECPKGEFEGLFSFPVYCKKSLTDEEIRRKFDVLGNPSGAYIVFRRERDLILT